MTRWPYEVDPTTPEEIQLYCVKDTVWQAFREGLKGLSTERKLDKLAFYRDEALLHWPTAKQRNWKVQVANYINALRRGGLLDDNLRVVK
jgi:hypothetical protein